MPQIRGGQVGGGGDGEWRRSVGGLTMPSDTGNQVVCTVGQTDSYRYSSPDHTTRRADVTWNSLAPQVTPIMHPSCPTGSVLVLCGLIVLTKSHL